MPPSAKRSPSSAALLGTPPQARESETARLARLLKARDGPKRIPFCPQEPTERQSAFLKLKCREALFGGAAGGGKSSALLMAALQYVDVPGYAAIIFRRSYTDLALPGALMDRAREWLHGSRAHWNDKEKTWTFPSGATLTFAYLENENDKFRYQSTELQFIALDELSQFSETQYTYMFSRLRRLQGVSIPIRMRAGSNPGGVGHEWVRDRFVKCAPSEDRVFVPAQLEDNPHLDIAEYEASLAELDELTYQQLRHGDWDVRPDGRMFKREWFEIVDAVPANLRWVRFWDFASSEPKEATDPDYTVGLKMGAAVRGAFYIADVRRERNAPADVEEMVAGAAEEDGRGVPQWIEQEPGSSGVSLVSHYIRNVLRGYACHAYRNTGSKATRAAPLAVQAKAGNVKLLRGAWNGPWLDELVAFPTKGIHDDQVDAASGALAVLASRGVPVYEEFSPLHVAEKPLGFWPGRTIYVGVTVKEAFAAVAGQVADGQLRILPPYVPSPERQGGVLEFADGVTQWLMEAFANPAEVDLADLKLIFLGDPEIAKPAATPGKAPSEVRSRFDILKRGLGDGREGTHWVVKAGPPNLSQRVEAVRGWLGKMVAGQPALLVDPEAHEVIESLGGEYHRPRGTDGVLESAPVENQAAAVAECVAYIACRVTRGLDEDGGEDVVRREQRSRAASRRGGWR